MIINLCGICLGLLWQLYSRSVEFLCLVFYDTVFVIQDYFGVYVGLLWGPNRLAELLQSGRQKCNLLPQCTGLTYMIDKDVFAVVAFLLFFGLTYMIAVFHCCHFFGLTYMTDKDICWLNIHYWWDCSLWWLCKDYGNSQIRGRFSSINEHFDIYL